MYQNQAGMARSSVSVISATLSVIFSRPVTDATRISTTSGVRQGCILAPILFCVAIDWIIQHMSLHAQEQVGRPATNRFHTSNWRSLETCCRPRTWWCNDATALVGYVKLMMMMMMFA